MINERVLSVVANSERSLYESDASKDMAFYYPEARIFGIDDNGLLATIASNRDVYDLIDDPATADELAEYNADSFVLVTYGWAAPITEDSDDSDIAPSQHKDKVRCRVFLYVCPSGIMSYVRLDKDPNDVMVEDNGAGSLADYCKELMQHVSDLTITTRTKAGK